MFNRCANSYWWLLQLSESVTIVVFYWKIILNQGSSGWSCHTDFGKIRVLHTNLQLTRGWLDGNLYKMSIIKPWGSSATKHFDSTVLLLSGFLLMKTVFPLASHWWTGKREWREWRVVLLGFKSFSFTSQLVHVKLGQLDLTPVQLQSGSNQIF